MQPDTNALLEAKLRHSASGQLHLLIGLVEIRSVYSLIQRLILGLTVRNWSIEIPLFGCPASKHTVGKLDFQAVEILENSKTKLSTHIIWTQN